MNLAVFFCCKSSEHFSNLRTGARTTRQVIGSDIFRRFARGNWFHPHSEERAHEQNSRAPKLSVGEPFVENPGGECHRGGWTKKLKSLSERDPNLVDCYIIQNVGERDTGNSGND